MDANTAMSLMSALAGAGAGGGRGTFKFSIKRKDPVTGEEVEEEVDPGQSDPGALCPMLIRFTDASGELR